MRSRSSSLALFSIASVACGGPSASPGVGERPFAITTMAAMPSAGAADLEPRVPPVDPSAAGTTPATTATSDRSAQLEPAPTAPTSELGPGTVPDVTRTLTRIAPDLKRCYERSLRNGPLVDLKLEIAIEVGADGRVLTASLDDARVPPDLSDCLLRRVKETTFSAPDRAPAHVRVPLLLRSR